MSSEGIEGRYSVRAVRDATDLDVGVSATVVATAAAEFWLGPTDVAVALAEGPGYRYVVSNLTDEVEIAPTEVGGTTYLLPIGVKVGIYCVPKNEDYAVIGKNPYLINEVEFGTTIDPTELPTAGGKPGTEVNPWKVGDGVMVHVKDETLIITGSGAMYDFASAADAPWAGVMSAVTAVTIENTVTHVGKNAFAGMTNLETINGEDVESTYRTVSTVNGKPIEQFNMMGKALGNEPLVYPPEMPTEPSGAVSGAEPERIKIVDGKVLLGVSVCTNGDLTAATEDWQKAKVEAVDLDEETGEAILTVPATAEKGFMFLKSKGAEK